MQRNQQAHCLVTDASGRQRSVEQTWRGTVQGVVDGDVRETCTACATTLLLEFGYLSHLTGVRSSPGAGGQEGGGGGGEGGR